jgi:putative nucleotidyltransferase with HDIG domain
MAPKPDRATVLVVDDERGPRESLRMLLTPNHEVLTSSSGANALEILRTEKVDVVTLDLNMPGIGGEELMRTIHAEHPHVEIIVITGCASLASAQEGIRHGICDYLQKPFDVVQVTAAVNRALTRGGARRGLVTFMEELGDAVGGRDRDTRRILLDVQRSQKMRGKLGNLFDRHGRLELAQLESDPGRTLEFLEVLAETIEINDSGMRGHARRVAFYAAMIADRLNLSVDDQERVRFAAFLHDLGKVGVPTDLMLRPAGLSAEERAIVEQHAATGARLLEPLGLPRAIPVAVRHHHERWDGNGYPDGLAGEEIPLIARVIAVADAFDAMSSHRPYRDALPRHVVIEEFERFAGSQFDPLIAKEFLAILEATAEDMDMTLLADSTEGLVPAAAR